MSRSQSYYTIANAKAPARFGRKNLLEYRSMLARRCEPHLLPGHKVPNHVRQEQGKKNRSIPIGKELYKEIISWTASSSLLTAFSSFYL